MTMQGTDHSCYALLLFVEGSPVCVPVSCLANTHTEISQPFASIVRTLRLSQARPRPRNSACWPMEAYLGKDCSQIVVHQVAANKVTIPWLCCQVRSCCLHNVHTNLPAHSLETAMQKIFRRDWGRTWARSKVIYDLHIYVKDRQACTNHPLWSQQ